jgi:hypothetical protein
LFGVLQAEEGGVDDLALVDHRGAGQGFAPEKVVDAVPDRREGALFGDDDLIEELAGESGAVLWLRAEVRGLRPPSPGFGAPTRLSGCLGIGRFNAQFRDEDCFGRS